VNELELIRHLTRSLPSNASVIEGAGDDCAVLDLGLPGHWVLFKTDAVVEGVHFTAETEPRKIGRKALARCLSDIAAMAGAPSAALVTVALPPGFDPARVEAIYDGLNELARQHGVAIAGGETTAQPAGLLLSVALLGTVEKERCLRRAGAQPGDALFVTGELGGSLSGKHLDFEPRLVEARWLAEQFDLHCMIDLSDGLASDLRHLLEAGRVGAELLAPSILISRAARQEARARAGAKTPLQAALTDGEDFELLFTVAARDAVPLLDAWKHQFPDLPLTCIGRITAEPGLVLRDRRSARPITEHGYVHFPEP
jgi:thiamine-monophosphate kinase